MGGNRRNGLFNNQGIGMDGDRLQQQRGQAAAGGQQRLQPIGQSQGMGGPMGGGMGGFRGETGGMGGNGGGW